jgi:hypothetical protein
MQSHGIDQRHARAVTSNCKSIYFSFRVMKTSDDLYESEHFPTNTAIQVSTEDNMSEEQNADAPTNTEHQHKP